MRFPLLASVRLGVALVLGAAVGCGPDDDAPPSAGGEAGMGGRAGGVVSAGRGGASHGGKAGGGGKSQAAGGRSDAGGSAAGGEAASAGRRPASGGTGSGTGGATGGIGAAGMGGTGETTGGTGGTTGGTGGTMGGEGGVPSAGSGGTAGSAAAAAGGTGGLPAAGGAGDAGDAGGPSAGGAGEGGAASVNCEGAPGPGCPCVRVAPDGDDAAAALSAGLTPFASVQAALDFAASQPESGSTVCVAAGEHCGASQKYGDAWLNDAESLYGGYESSTWTRCSDSEAHVAVLGCDFGAGAGSTVIDGFTVDGYFYAESTLGLRLNRVNVMPTSPAATDAAQVNFGAELTWTASRIETTGGNGLVIREARVTLVSDTIATTGAGAIWVDGNATSLLELVASSVSSDFTLSGNPSHASSAAIYADDGRSIFVDSLIEARGGKAIELGGARPGSRISSNQLVVEGAAAALALSNADDTEIFENSIELVAETDARGILAMNLAGNAAIVDNHITLKSDSGVAVEIVSQATNQPPMVASNALTVTTSDSSTSFSYALRCDSVFFHEAWGCFAPGNGYPNVGGLECVTACSGNGNSISSSPVTATCGAGACSGHGECDAAHASIGCACDAGFARAGGDALACPVDSCAQANGGCDVLTACINLPSGRACGPCPTGYLGDGSAGCVQSGG